MYTQLGIATASSRYASVFGVGARYEALAPLAQVVFSLPATSTAAERAQSVSGRVCSALRARLSTEAVDGLTLVQHYIANKHGTDAATFNSGMLDTITEQELVGSLP